MDTRSSYEYAQHLLCTYIHQDLISPMIVGRLIVAEVLIMDFVNDSKFAPAVLLKLSVI